MDPEVTKAIVGFGTAPIVAALIQAAKQRKLLKQDRWVFLWTMALAFVVQVLFTLMQGVAFNQVSVAVLVFQGLTSGLAANGAYDQGAAAIRQVRKKRT